MYIYIYEYISKFVPSAVDGGASHQSKLLSIMQDTAMQSSCSGGRRSDLAYLRKATTRQIAASITSQSKTERTRIATNTWTTVGI